MNGYINELMKRYMECLDMVMDFEEWKKHNPDKSVVRYPFEVPTREELKRLGIMIRNETLRMEKHIDV